MLVPLPTDVPPQLPEYHCQAAPVPRVPPVNDKVEDEPEHMVEGKAETAVGATETVFTVTVTDSQRVLLQSPSDRT